MFHYLAKLGKNPKTKYIMPLIAGFTSTGYLALHTHGHNIVRDLLAASSQSGKREEISTNLQKLIMQVYSEIKDVFNKPVIESELYKTEAPTIKWFASSSPDPITLGLSESKSGIVIGLPAYYNYEKREDIPDDILQIKRIKMFKSWNKNNSDQEKKEETNLDDFGDSFGDNISKTRIDKNTPEAQQYIESILLSENAKKFSIARELFVGDSYRPFVIAAVMLVSMILSISIARAAVNKLRLTDAHLSYRLPVYWLSGVAGYANYISLADTANRHYSLISDSRAIKINDSYREGAIEYLTKNMQRNRALRSLVEDMKYSYDEEGNLVEKNFRRKHVPLTERLEAAQKKDDSDKK